MQMDGKPKNILPSAMALSLESMKNSSWMKSGSEPFLSVTHPLASVPSRKLTGVRALLTVIGDSVNKMPPRFDPNLFSDDDDEEEEGKRSYDVKEKDDESSCDEDKEEMESYDVKNGEGKDSYDAEEKEKKSNDARENIHMCDVKEKDESFSDAASVSMGSNKSLQLTDKIDSTDSCSMKSLNSATRREFVYNTGIKTTNPISSVSVKPPIMERGKRTEQKFQHSSDFVKPDSHHSASSRSKLEGQENNTIDDYNWKKLLTSNVFPQQTNSAVKLQQPENGKICDLPKQRSSARKNLGSNASRTPLNVLKQSHCTDTSKENVNKHSGGKDAHKFHHDAERVDNSVCDKQKLITHVSQNTSLRTPLKSLKPTQCADISKENVNIHSRGKNVNKFNKNQERAGHTAYEKQKPEPLIPRTAPSHTPMEMLKPTNSKKNASTCSGQKNVNTFCRDSEQADKAGCKKEKLVPQVSQNEPGHKQNVVVYQGNVNGLSGSGAQTMMPVDFIVVNKKPYACLDVLGSGGSSKVYSVYEVSTKSNFAVKHVNLCNADNVIINGYKKEIEYLKMLQGSERVIKMFDYEYRDKELYLVLEKGCNDFAHYLANATKNGPLPPVRIKHFWLQMLEAVAEIHKHGIVHSDLKPANFLVVGGDLKLIDFGIADKVPADMTSAVREAQVGTLNYISPEALTCQSDNTHGNYAEQKYVIKVGVKADVWSLGCILYNVVYGCTPFQNIRMVAQKLRAIIDPNYEIPFPPIDDALLLDVLKSCLKRNPKERASVEELLNHPYLDSKAVNKVPCTPVKSRRDFQDMLHELESLTPGRMGVVYEFIAQKKNESVKKQQLP